MSRAAHTLRGALAGLCLAMASPALAQLKQEGDVAVAWAKDRGVPDEHIRVHVLRTLTDTTAGISRQVYTEEVWLVSVLPKPPFHVVWVMLDAQAGRRPYVLLQFPAVNANGEKVTVGVERDWIRLQGADGKSADPGRPAQRPRSERMHGLEN